MFLKSVKLENIRSYVSEEIRFPNGSVLLSGDIGCGKSTILLAIEFALFGVSSDLPGSTLLRHGKQTGSVELNFTIDNKNVIIKRNLKRAKDNIGQDNGYIIIDELKTDLAATDIKARILNLLGYPRESLKKKSLIYRYTVYTPQEEMKLILFEDNEKRLDTLRKVFGIDKYKKITENSRIFITSVKDEKKELAGKIFDLEDKIKQKSAKQNELAVLDEKYKKLIPASEEIKQKLNEKKESIKKYEESIKKLNEAKTRLKIIENSVMSEVSNYEAKKRELEKIGNEIKIFLEKNKKEDIKFDREHLEKLQKEYDSFSDELINVKSELNSASKIKNDSEESKSKISRLSSCPTCGQNVDEHYKNEICSREDLKIKEVHEKINLFNAKKEEIAKKLEALKADLNEFKKLEIETERKKAEFGHMQEKMLKKGELENELIKSKSNVAKLNSEKIELTESIDSIGSIENEYDSVKKECDSVIIEQRKNDIEMASVKTSLSRLQKEIEIISVEIDEKILFRERINYLANIQVWFEDFFIPLISTIEKQVMSRVHFEFNELVQKWFNALVEDEIIQISLDENFAPKVQQNGYDTNIENLSGGEKTACALAYRLSLNKVINDFIGDIKTKDLIILDEPTDGFSSEQLDKVRDILDELKINQTIIVSHEHKIESFVDHVLKVAKSGHISKVL